jgi:hypothetical protein
VGKTEIDLTATYVGPLSNLMVGTVASTDPLLSLERGHRRSRLRHQHEVHLLQHRCRCAVTRSQPVTGERTGLSGHARESAVGRRRTVRGGTLSETRSAGP